MDNNKMDLGEKGCDGMDWIGLAQYPETSGELV
jgi:hypothetical protein